MPGPTAHYFRGHLTTGGSDLNAQPFSFIGMMEAWSNVLPGSHVVKVQGQYNYGSGGYSCRVGYLGRVHLAVEVR